MIWLRLNLWPTSGWPSAWARTTGFTTSTPSVQAWESHNHEHYLFSTHFQGATQFLPSTARERSRFGRPGRAYGDVTETFVYLAGHPFQLLDADDHHFLKLERLTVILYDKTSHLSSVNEARMELFCHKNRAMDNLPPTKDALLQHTRRAVYQAGVWTMSTHTHLVVPSPQDFAWTKVSESWVPVWMTIPEVSRSCSELVKCSCK